jgi:hypothetical protein
MLPDRMKLTVGIAGVLILIAALIATVRESNDGDDAVGFTALEAREPSVTPRSSAALLSCPGAPGVRSSYREAAGEFTLVGKLEAVDGGYFTVEAAGEAMELVLAGDSRVSGQYTLGDPVRVQGRLSGASRLEAVKVEPACGLVADVPTAGTASPTVASATVTPAPTPPAFRTPVLPAFVPQQPEEPLEEPAPEVTEPPVVDITPPPEPTPAPTEPPPTEEPRPSRTPAPEETPIP